MNTMAETIKNQFDALLDEYDLRLQKHPAYVAMPAPFRREAARRTLDFAADWLQSGDDTQLIQFIQSTAQQRAAQGLDIKIMQHAVYELGNILEPSITDVETAKLIWRMLAKAQDAITQQATERLIAEGNRLRLMVDRSPVGIYHTTTEGRVIDANEAFLKIIGYASLEAINQVGMPALYENPTDRQRLIAMLRQGPVTGFETNFRRADGQVIAISLSVRLVQEAGAAPYLEGILEDITERKRTEETIQDSEEKLRAIYEGTNDAVMLLNEKGFFDCNPQTLEMFGFKTKEEFTAVHPADVSPPLQPDGQESLPAAQAHIQTAYRQGYDRFEWIHRRTNGEDFPAEVLLSAFDFGGQRVLQATVRDITERKRIEQRLNESEERYRRLSDATVEGIVIHDKGILLDANEVFAKMFGYELSEVIGMAATEFLTPETREITVQNIRSGHEKPYEVMGLRKDGSTFPVEITGKAIPYEGQTVRVTALRDITERQRSREQIERILQETRVRFEVSQALAGQKTEDEVLASLIQQAGIYPQALVTIATFDKPGDDIVAVARYAESFESGLTPNLPMGTRFPFSQFPLFRLLSADRPFVSQDTFADDRMDAASIEITREIGAAGFAVFPLTADSEWLGYMMVFAKSIGFFDEGKQHLYQTLVEQGATALQTARLRDQIQTSLERRGHQVQVSTQMAQEIAAAPVLDELFRRVVTLIKERFGYYHAQIFRYEPLQDAVVLVAGYGEAGQKMLAAGHKLAMGRGVVGTAAATGRSILASDVAQDKYWWPNPNLPDTKGELAVPIKLRDQVLGILDIQSGQAGALTADDRLLLEGLCGQIAIAIENKRAEQSFQEQATFWQRLIDNIPSPIFYKDIQGVYRGCNTAFEQYLGKPKDQIMGTSVYDMAPKDLADKYHAMDVVLFEKPGTQVYDSKVVYADGTRHDVIFNKATLFALDGSVGGLVGVMVDITERKQAETKMQEALQELERLYRATAREGWQAYREAAQTAPGYLFDHSSLTPQASWEAQIEQGIQQNTLVLSTGEQSVAVTPLAVRGEVIGAIGVYDDPDHPLSPDERTLLQEIAEQGALALESARLFEQTQRDAERERTISAISERIYSTTDVKQLMQITAEELRRATGSARAVVRLNLGTGDTLEKLAPPAGGSETSDGRTIR